MHLRSQLERHFDQVRSDPHGIRQPLRHAPPVSQTRHAWAPPAAEAYAPQPAYAPVLHPDEQATHSSEEPFLRVGVPGMHPPPEAPPQPVAAIPSIGAAIQVGLEAAYQTPHGQALQAMMAGLDAPAEEHPWAQDPGLEALVGF